MYKNLNVRSLGVSGGESEIIELALSHGFRGIDLDIVEFAERVEDQGLERARRFLDSAKLQLGSFQLPVDWYDDANYERDMRQLPKLAELAAELGCARATTLIEPASDDRPFHDNFEFHRARLGQIGAALSSLGVRLGLRLCTSAARREGKHYEFVHDVGTFGMLLGTIQADNVGAAVDLWSMHVGGGTVADLANMSVDRIVTVDVSDAVQDDVSESSRRLPGETGVIDTAAALVVLAELGYEGPITPSASASCFTDLNRDATVKLAGEKLNEVWTAAGLTPRGKLPVAATE